ncbi:MAG: bifunctional ornithine acetyltransferase/N-acetylglutamate synthase, partial [Chloroflexi bacterium]|nr:bifunctional ornithine acetyltransferase/N-acetylglutamate synthase [Chloroflexota bacterium]
AQLRAAIAHVSLALARQMAADAEGSTKVIEVNVRGAADDRQARVAARTVASSTLLKCAIHGNDPNWGRVLMALGNAAIDLAEDRVYAAIAGIPMVERGTPLAFDATAASQAMDAPAVVIDVDLGLGDGQATALGCDMSEEFVTLNADYTT